MPKINNVLYLLKACMQFALNKAESYKSYFSNKKGQIKKL